MKNRDAPPLPDSLLTFRKALVVDDNIDAANSLALLLKFHGLEVHTAHDGLDAVDSAERIRPDIILLDIGMPKMNGYDACRTIRNHFGPDKVAIVALTGWGQEEDRQKSKEAGFDAHLVKPVSPTTLLNILAEFSKPVGQDVGA